MKASRWFVTCALAAAIASTTSSARAEGEPATEAQGLFDEAKQLVLQGRWADACPKLARSNQLDPRATTLFRLAECYENTGKPASAWSAYLGSAAAAGAAGESKRADFAKERAKKIEPSVPHLIIAVAQRPIVVYADAERIDEARLGTKIPIDPGNHIITADAPGKQRFQVSTPVVDAGTTVITIPPLADVPSAHASPSKSESTPSPTASHAQRPAPETSSSNPGLRRWSIVFAGAGVAAAGTGLALSLTSEESADGSCKGACAAGTGLIVGGALLAATGIAFFLASFGDSSSSGARVSKTSPALFTF